jgi:hypothetical protein
MSPGRIDEENVKKLPCVLWIILLKDKKYTHKYKIEKERMSNKLQKYEYNVLCKKYFLYAKRALRVLITGREILFPARCDLTSSRLSCLGRKRPRRQFFFRYGMISRP